MESNRLCVCLLLLSLSGCLQASEKQTLDYKMVNDQPLQIDVYDYSGGGSKGKAPTLIYIHGGGWELFSKDDVPDYVNHTAMVGKFILVSVQYRLTSEAVKWGSVDAVTWPAQGEDCLDAVAYVFEHAKTLGVDKDRMACWGGSAGGHLCAYTALAGSEGSAQTRLVAAAVFYPPTNILTLYADVDPSVGIDRPVLQANSFESLLLGSAKSHVGLGDIISHMNNTASPWPQLLKLAESVNPAYYIDKKSPAMLIAHGTEDHIVPFKQGVRLAGAIEHYNHTCVFLTANGCDHAALPRSCWQATIDQTSEWLYQALK